MKEDWDQWKQTTLNPLLPVQPSLAHIAVVVLGLIMIYMKKRHIQVALVIKIGSPGCFLRYDLSLECTEVTLQEGQVLMALMLSCFYNWAAKLFPQ